MSTKLLTDALGNPVPDPSREDWIDFLYWLARREDDAFTVVYAIEKPWKFANEYADYLAEGGLDR